MQNNLYFIYARKSSEDNKRQALSIPAQLRELKEFAAKNDIKVKYIFQEEKSARKPGRRPEFNEMLDRIRKGECRNVLCWHTNRLSRNPQEAGVIQQMLTDKVLLEIRTPYETIDSNTNDVMLGVSFGSNSQYSKELSYNTKRGMREKVSRGEWPTRAPAFYINSGTQKGSKNIVPDPKWASYYEKWIDQIIQRRLNLGQATRLLKDMGVKTKTDKAYTQSMVHRIMRMPVYYGFLRYSNYEETMGKWKPLVTKQKWDQLQSVLDDKSKPSQTKYNHAYRRFIKCAKCGLTVTAYTKLKAGRHYTYYVCSKRNGNCGNPPITFNEMEEMLRTMVRQVQINESQLTMLRKITREKLESELTFETGQRKDIESKTTVINQKLDNLLNMRIEGEVTQDEYLTAKNKLQSDLNHLDQLRGDLGVTREDVRNQLELFFDSAFNLEKVFVQGTLDEKTRLVYALTEKIELEDENLRWNLRKPWQQLVLIKNEPNTSNWGE